jgi:hypothetical protein
MPSVRSNGLSDPSSSERRNAVMAPLSAPAKEETKVRGSSAAEEREGEKKARVMARRSGGRRSGKVMGQPYRNGDAETSEIRSAIG